MTNVVDLVVVSMNQLPETMPASFQSLFTSITNPGSPTHIEHIARLLSTQLTAGGYDSIQSQEVIIKQNKEMILKYDFSLLNPVILIM